MKSKIHKLAEELKEYASDGSLEWVVANDYLRLHAENKDLQRRLTAYQQSCNVANTQIEALKTEIDRLENHSRTFSIFD